jgi:hypothetical protein
VITQFVVGEFFLKFSPSSSSSSSSCCLLLQSQKKKNGSFEINDFGFTTLFCVVSKKSLLWVLGEWA